MMNGLRLAIERSSTQGVGCTFSAGVESLTPGDTLSSALARADMALYIAKETGRNRLVMASEVGFHPVDDAPAPASA